MNFITTATPPLPTSFQVAYDVQGSDRGPQAVNVTAENGKPFERNGERPAGAGSEGGAGGAGGAPRARRAQRSPREE